MRSSEGTLTPSLVACGTYHNSINKARCVVMPRPISYLLAVVYHELCNPLYSLMFGTHALTSPNDGDGIGESCRFIRISQEPIPNCVLSLLLSLLLKLLNEGKQKSLGVPRVSTRRTEDAYRSKSLFHEGSIGSRFLGCRISRGISS